MKKMKTLFKRDFTDNHEVILHNEVNEGCEWVLAEEGIATRKMDGTACLVKEGKLYARFDCWLGNKDKKQRKAGKPFKGIPEGFIPCQENPDPISGSFPGWIPLDIRRKDDNYKHFFNVWDNLKEPLEDGTYELCGPHFNNNYDKLEQDVFTKHGSIILNGVTRTFDGIKEYLSEHPMEGIVFHRGNGEMVKIKRSDYGLPWGRKR